MIDPAEVEINLDELRADLSERGHLEFELAQLRATNRKLAAIIREMQQTTEEK